MDEDKPGIGDRLSGAVERAKEAVGGGSDEPQGAEAAEGRVAAVRSSLRAFGEGDQDGFFAVFSQEVEWVAPEGEKFPGAGTHQGQDAVRERFVSAVARTYPSFGFHPDHYLEAPDEEWVVTLGKFVGEGDDGPLDVPATLVFEFDGDEVSRLRIYTDSDAFTAVKEEGEAEREDDDSEESEESKPESSGEDEGDGKSDDDDKRDDESDEDKDRGEPQASGQGDDAGDRERSSSASRDHSSRSSEGDGQDESRDRGQSEQSEH